MHLWPNRKHRAAVLAVPGSKPTIEHNFVSVSRGIDEMPNYGGLGNESVVLKIMQIPRTVGITGMGFHLCTACALVSTVFNINHH